jgi:hypothetical protein
MRTVIASLVVAAVSSAASAQSIESYYNSTAEKACKTVDKAKEGDGDWVVQSCPRPRRSCDRHHRGRPAHDGVGGGAAPSIIIA